MQIVVHAAKKSAVPPGMRMLTGPQPCTCTDVDPYVARDPGSPRVDTGCLEQRDFATCEAHPYFCA